MSNIRQMTRKGDPTLRIMLSKAIKFRLMESPKKNKRRPQDELIKRLAASVEHDRAFQSVQFDLLQKQEVKENLSKFGQVVPSEMKEYFEKSAENKGISLELEIASRLQATFETPTVYGLDSLIDQILRVEFSTAEAVAECKRKREAALFVYEMEKLRLFMRFEQRLPSEMKEKFLVINVEEAMKIIKAELDLEKKND